MRAQHFPSCRGFVFLFFVFFFLLVHLCGLHSRIRFLHTSFKVCRQGRAAADCPAERPASSERRGEKVEPFLGFPRKPTWGEGHPSAGHQRRKRLKKGCGCVCPPSSPLQTAKS